MTSFFFNKREKSASSLAVNATAIYIEPECEDIACLREVEVQRFKWNAFIKSRPNIWKENWLWQHWQKECKAPARPIKRIMQIFSSKMKAQTKLKKLIRGGVPPELRGSVWWACSGAADKMKMAGPQDQYSVLVEIAKEKLDQQILSDIEKDLLRTFPERIKEENLSLVDSLRRVLTAYALRNTFVGYCQSMNYICALLLFHLSEEQAFWLMATLLEDLLPNNYYAPSLLGGRIDQQVFQSCVAWKLPKIHSAFKKTNTLLEPIICPWFLCLYINVLPLYTVCRVWDCMFWEGSVVLFRIGLTLMKSKMRHILDANDFIGVYGVLKSSNGGAAGPNREHSFILESASVSLHSSSSNNLEVSPSVSTSSSSGQESMNSISDSQHLINSTFGARWMRSVPSTKVEILRQKFHKLLDKDREDSGRHSSSATSSNNNKTVPSSPNSSPSKSSVVTSNNKRSRKSTYMLRVLEENDITTLHDLALELDEGLGEHVEEFARELHTESSDGGEEGCGVSPDGSNSRCFDEDEEDFDEEGGGEEEVDEDYGNDVEDGEDCCEA